ncbi:uncharacterized protein LOC106376911 [Brassica napus]|uniref:CREG-like beta-barrel domain-containing protein n=2 Tax=Brassica TaxID=3705 RepID=A0A0D3ABW6_BRAOL|nr:PREDICTED: uncharacterized protein LOC106314681 isoform X2 [Brassica oleracea var. oleracea]XP_013672494.1 uncharacterized protein LOC106376911 [Brassica napus]CAF2077248.1 unnamed protein product [Brassica napus]
MSMEALSTSSHISNLPQVKPLLKSSLPSSQSSCWLCNPRIPNLRISDGSSHVGLRIQALSHNDDAPSDEGDAAESSGLGLFPGDIFSLSQTSLALPQGCAGNSGGNRAGLYRTPISGGVQNATSAHALPPPALAVRNLLEQARFAHLCTVMSKMHHRREGYPFGSLVDFAPDRMGHPIFLFSPLAIHTRNLLAEPRCSLVVQIPGWSGLSNARVTLFGDVYPLSQDEQEWAHKQYSAKHHHGPSEQWGNFHYFRMHNISDIYFIGGFGTVAWVDVKEYEALQPDKIAVDGGEQNLKELNAIFSKPLRELLSTESEVDDAALISIDSKGIDVRVRQGAQFNIQRLAFEEGHGVETLEEAKAALWKVMEKVKLNYLQK